jgi:hypothetical protein
MTIMAVRIGPPAHRLYLHIASVEHHRTRSADFGQEIQVRNVATVCVYSARMSNTGL